LYNRGRTRIEGRYYANFFESAVDVADYVVDNRAGLRERSRRFLRDFYDSSAPAFVLDQVNSHLNTFFTSSWLTRDGNFGILEGLGPERSYGPLVTVDVSIYGAMSVSALFPELHRSMMRAHGELQAPSGEVGHGINKDFRMTDVQETVQGRLDLPSQYAILVLRGFFWTGDREYLEEMWPSVKAALDYVLRERDADGDCLPDMEGAMCTYDNFKMYGASSYVSSLWLSALMKAIDAARVLGDAEAAERYSRVLQSARQSFEEKLWNGRYYRLFNDADGEHGELDEGCLTDQLIGQWTNHLTGSGGIVERSRVRKALESICGMSMQPWGLVNCRWPEDEFLHPVPDDCWHDQSNTIWSGVELAFASFLIYEDMYEQAMAVIDNVDSRYRRWGLYWDHIEFGGHYYRPMSAWGILNALLGLTISGAAYGFDPKVPQQDVKLFFSFGDGTAHFAREVSDRTEQLRVAVCTGTFRCAEVTLGMARGNEGVESVTVGGQPLPEAAWSAGFDGRTARVTFAETVEVPAGQALSITLR
ncbi:MAG: GH116 family glycosyl hydrolase, partial [Candidatus Brocadiaceae bacterium]